MRNPTVSIQTGIEQAIYNSVQIKKVHKSFKEFQNSLQMVVKEQMEEVQSPSAMLMDAMKIQEAIREEMRHQASEANRIKSGLILAAQATEEALQVPTFDIPSYECEIDTDLNSSNVWEMMPDERPKNENPLIRDRIKIFKNDLLAIMQANDVNIRSNLPHVEEFIFQIFDQPEELSTFAAVRKNNVKSVECQTEFSLYEPGYGIDIITKFEAQMKQIGKLLGQQKIVLEGAMEQWLKIEEEREMCKKAKAVQESFTTSILNQLHYYQRRSEDVLRKQMFSQRMVENLINDLLDLAKLENSSFVLDKSYFNLAEIIN